jgi:hypothetical protein
MLNLSGITSEARIVAMFVTADLQKKPFHTQRVSYVYALSPYQILQAWLK